MGKKKKKSGKQTKAHDPAKIAAGKNRPLPKQTSPIPVSHNWFARLGPGILLLAFATLIYLPSFQGSFHLDDLSSIVKNPYVHITDLKPETLFRAAFQDGLQNRPLSNLSLGLNFYFNRTSTFGYHLANFAFFLLTSLAVWLLLERLLLRLGYAPGRSAPAAWLCGLLWASHPLHTQAVSYIVQRHASFAGAFMVWSVYFYHLGLEAKRRRFLLFGLCGACGISAVLCKETAVVLPGLLLLYKLYFFDELKPGWLRRNAIWIIGLAVLYALGAAAFLRPEMLEHLRREFAGKNIDPWEKFLSAPRSLFWYLYLILFPFPQFLSLVHEFPLSTGWLHPPSTLLSWLALLLVVSAALVGARRFRIFSFAVLWYLGTLAVEAMPLPIEIVNEHRLYLALLSLLVPFCAWPLLKAKRLMPALAWGLVIALFFGFFTFTRNRVWVSEISLWGDVARKAPESELAYNGLASAYVERGRPDLVIQVCSKAIELNPRFAEAYSNRGVAYYQKGLLDLAIRDLSRAIELDANLAEAYSNRALAYDGKNQLDLALQDYDRAIAINPEYAYAYNNRGWAYFKMGRLDLAIQDYSRAIAINPGYAQAYKNRGWAYKTKGQLDKAQSDFARASELE